MLLRWCRYNVEVVDGVGLVGLHCARWARVKCGARGRERGRVRFCLPQFNRLAKVKARASSIWVLYTVRLGVLGAVLGQVSGRLVGLPWDLRRVDLAGPSVALDLVQW